MVWTKLWEREGRGHLQDLLWKSAKVEGSCGTHTAEKGECGEAARTSQRGLGVTLPVSISWLSGAVKLGQK